MLCADMQSREGTGVLHRGGLDFRRGREWLTEYPVGHGCVTGAAERLGVEIRVVELAVDLSGLYLSKGNLLLDIIDDHQEMFAFLGKCTFVIGDGDDRAVVFHNDGW